MPVWLLPQLCSSACCVKLSGLLQLVAWDPVEAYASGLTETSYSPIVPQSVFLHSFSLPSWSLPGTPSPVTQIPHLSLPPVTGYCQFYFANSFKLESKVYIASLGVHQDLLIRANQILGASILAGKQKQHQTNHLYLRDSILQSGSGSF